MNTGLFGLICVRSAAKGTSTKEEYLTEGQDGVLTVVWVRVSASVCERTRVGAQCTQPEDHPVRLPLSLSPVEQSWPLALNL
jgi:hypothetical protein